MNYFILTSSFSVFRVVNNMVADNVCEIVIREDALINLGAQQLVTIAKSMNSELKVNNKQSKESIVEAIMAEAINFPIEDVVQEVEMKPRTANTKTVCFAAFDKIDMSNKAESREVVKTLVESYGLNLRVVQSYASNYRKAQNNG